MIGYFGPGIIFETSDDRILSFKNFNMEAAGRWVSHEIIAIKPKTEFIGPGLDTVTFTIHLNGNHGVKPRSEMNKWLEYAHSGKAEILVVGAVLGVDKWVVKSVSQAWDVVLSHGEIFSGKVDVTLEEYVSMA